MIERVIFNTTSLDNFDNNELYCEIPLIYNPSTGEVNISNFYTDFQEQDRKNFIGLDVLTTIKEYDKLIKADIEEVFEIVIENSKLQVVENEGLKITYVEYPKVVTSEGEILKDTTQLEKQPYNTLSSYEIDTDKEILYIARVIFYFNADDDSFMLTINDVFRYNKDINNNYTLAVKEDYKLVDLPLEEQMQYDLLNLILNIIEWSEETW